jgi:1-acyl-sn-glycerol-3-phosphate acyltransferase
MPKAPPPVVVQTVATTYGWGFIVGGFIFCGLVVVPLTLVAQPFWPPARQAFNSFINRALRTYFELFPFLRIEVEGREAPLEGPRVIVANHQSWLDPVVMIALEPRLGGPAQPYLFRTPVLRSILRLGHFHPVGEVDPELVEQMRRGVREAKAEGRSLLYFPEGSRSRTGEIGHFSRGAFRMAVEQGLPIQPVVIDGLDEVYPPGRFKMQVPGPFAVRIRYLEPLRPPFPEGTASRVAKELTREVRKTMEEELSRLRAERQRERAL